MGKKNKAVVEQVKPVIVSENETPQPSDKPAPALSSVPPSEPPQSALHARVITYMDGIREATTTKLHELAIECLEHGKDTGDVRPLLAMQNHMPKSLRKVAFAAWALSFAPLDWGKRDKQDNCDNLKVAKEGSKNFKPWNIEGAKAVAFYDVQEATKPKGIRETLKLLMSTRDGYQKMLDDPKILRKDGLTDEAISKEIATLTVAIKAIA